MNVIEVFQQEMNKLLKEIQGKKENRRKCKKSREIMCQQLNCTTQTLEKNKKSDRRGADDKENQTQE